MPISIGLNVGGTFTNTVAYSDKGVQLAKVPSYADDLPRILDESIQKLDLDMKEVTSFVISFPLAMHPLLARKGAETGLICNEGYIDTLDIQEGRKPYVLRAQQDKIYPLIKRRNRRGISARMDPDGNELVALNMGQVAKAAEELIVGRGLKSTAVCLLFSYVNSAHEVKVRDYICEKYPNVEVCISSEVSPIIGEFRRMSTTAVNAYVNPKVRSSIDEIQKHLLKKGLNVPLNFLQSSGGVITAEAAKKMVVQLMWSCPAGGVMGARNLYYDSKDIITFDMGGTTTDVCLIKDGEPPFVTESKISEYLLQFPVIDVKSESLGGGSIAWVDPWGALNIGPNSSGLEPGPACYDKGGDKATVTDALLVLGIYPDNLLGGNMKLNIDAARKAIGDVADARKSSIEETAESIYRLTYDNIHHYISGLMNKKGFDPRDFTLVAYGGAGPAIAPYVLKELQAKRVIIPTDAGVFTAMGLLTIDLVHELARSYLTFLHKADITLLNSMLSDLETEAINLLKAEHVNDEDITLMRMAEMRYFNQSNILSIPLPDQKRYDELALFGSLFHEAHHKLYGFSFLDDPVELVGVKIRGIGKLPTVKLKKIEKTKGDLKQATKGRREVIFPLVGKKDTLILDRKYLRAGDKIKGPAIIEEDTSNTLIPPDMRAEIDDYGAIVLNIQ